VVVHPPSILVGGLLAPPGSGQATLRHPEPTP